MMDICEKFLGDSNLQTTLVYLHLTDDAGENARDKLNQLADQTTVETLFAGFKQPHG